MASKRFRIIFITLLCATLLGPALVAHAKGAAVTATISTDSVSVTVSLELIENLTTSLPALDTVLDQSSPVLSPFQKGFQSMVPGAQIESMTLRARTLEINNSTGLWGFLENYTITVSGVNSNTGGRVLADMAFLSSKINDSMSVSGVELNNLGRSYLLQGIQRFPPDDKTRYFAQSSEFTLPVVPEQVTSGFSLLDLSWVSPVSNWQGGYQPFDPSTIWNLKPRAPIYNVTVGVGITPENTFLKVYTAFLNPSIEIIAPPRSVAEGTTIMFDVPTFAEAVMPVIIVVSLISIVATILLDRRISKSTRLARGRKR